MKRKFRKGPVMNPCRKPAEARRLYAEVGRGGVTISELARRLGWSYNTVYGKLPGLERLGLLLAEDPQGQLYQFE